MKAQKSVGMAASPSFAIDALGRMTHVAVTEGRSVKNPALVLSTVNAPYSQKLDAQALVHCLLNQAAAKQTPGHISSFFGEVEPALQLEFAQLFNITEAELIASAKAFAAYTGESYPLAG